MNIEEIEEKDSIEILSDTELDINTIYSVDLRTYNYAVKIVLSLIKKQNKHINELENKLMYALSPTSHELAINTQENFKKIIRENINEDTYTIRKKLNDYWKGNESKWNY